MLKRKAAVSHITNTETNILTSLDRSSSSFVSLPHPQGEVDGAGFAHRYAMQRAVFDIVPADLMP